MTVTITFDIDWAPDFIINDVADLVSSYGVKSTWFVTHRSPAIDRLAQQPEWFELGIHPNFSVISTHGTEVIKIIDHCLTLVPDAVSSRSHGLVQSTTILASLLESSIKVDASLYLPRITLEAPLDYRWNRRRLWRVPFFWEDDLEFQYQQPSWEALPLLQNPGIKMFCFHPIHVYLNSRNAENYVTLKNGCPHLNDATDKQLINLINPGRGTRTFLESLLFSIRRSKIDPVFVKEVPDACTHSISHQKTGNRS